MYRQIRSNRSSRAVRVLPVAQGETPAGLGRASLDRAVATALKQTPFRSDLGETRLVEGRIILAGLGPASQITAAAWRRAAAGVLRCAFANRLPALCWTDPAKVSDLLPAPEVATAIAAAVNLANYDFDEFRSSPAGKKEKPLDLDLSIDGGKKNTDALSDSLLVGKSVDIARRLGATPPNVANPAYMARFCRDLARKTPGLRCSIIDQTKAKQLKMGGLLAVGSGGSTPPVMIVLEYDGRASSPAKRANQKSKIKHQKSAAPIMLVGKAVTFDTGGYSLKPGGGKTMKYDKCGGCAVIAAMAAAAQLKLPQRLVALVPCVENMIDSDSYRVDDIVTFVNGMTCEVTNTDAEGRLILADALSYGTKRYQPRAVVDLATLTGGVMVALGPFCGGLFANDDKLAEQLIASGQSSGERLWRLPLWNELRDMMKGSHADLINASDKRWAHPGQGAGFLSHFVGKDAASQMPTLPWAHLDIAAVANTEGDSVELAKGPTGFGVRLLIDWLRAHA